MHPDGREVVTETERLIQVGGYVYILKPSSCFFGGIL